MTTVPSPVIELVETFDRNIDAFRSSQYNETQLRREFIDPLFEQLGWDVANKAGHAHAYKDVIHEDAISVGSATKAPDYCFRIGGTRKFFLEAKKPSINIKDDPEPAYQLRRYAWSAGLPLSILTDFEEFAVYDCLSRPKQTDRASTARIMYLTYNQYLDSWSKIADIFAREAVLKGSFDKFAASTKGKRGTTTVDVVFLAEIEKWREMLAKIIALRNRNLSQPEINFAVQCTIDRILFLRMCEDRGIERYGQLQSISSGDRTYPRLCEIFERADQKYNSGLFHFHLEPGRTTPPDTLTPSITIDDKDLKWILYNLYYPQCPYEFSVLPPEILGNVYEQFLGKVITLTPAHHAKIEDKPEVKKAGGVYYTPSYIVDYIVKNTVGKLIEGKTPKQIENIKILDPACGSGSFLLGAYTCLLNYHRDWYVAHNGSKHSKKIYEGRASHHFLTIAEKKRILLNNIFGVDIDSQAVEVTKLSLLLKVLEGENSQTLENQYRLFHERALPDLAANIKCGNSLIAPDFFDNFESEQRTTNNELYEKINPFDWKQEFPQIFSRKTPGFDAVIGNPPYVRIQTMKETQPQSVPYFSSKYDSASKGNYDIYVVFVEKALQLLNSCGRMGYIIPHKFFNAKYGQPLRNLISKGKNLSQVVHFGYEQVFVGAMTYTCLLFLDRQSQKKCNVVKVKKLTEWRNTGQAIEGTISSDNIGAKEWNFVVGAGKQLFERLSAVPVKLGDVAAKIFQGLVTGADPVFIMENISEGEYKSAATGKTYYIEPELMHPLCKGSVNLRRYRISEITRSILFPYKLVSGKAALLSTQELDEQFPNASAYLKENRQKLESREGGKWKRDNWYAFGRSQNLSEMEQEKILTPSIANRTSFTLDTTDGYYFVGSGGGGGGGYGITLKHSYLSLTYFYLLGLLNSKLLDWLLKQTSSPFSGGYYSYNRQYIEPLPIPTIDFDNPDDVAKHDKMLNLVDRILDLHKKLPAAKIPDEKTKIQRQIDTTDRQIDHLVYGLYDLTEEEIEIVEEKDK